MERESSRARYQALHEQAPYHNGAFTQWSDTRSPATPIHMDEGVTTGVADYDATPWDNFTTQVDASPTPPKLAADEVAVQGQNEQQ